MQEVIDEKSDASVNVRRIEGGETCMDGSKNTSSVWLW
jgi:hypothetical protein